ncbi:hypothetical protein QWY87_03625 [Lutimonas halocynthiae]|uniref:hypothetical protein n=1 Tax=Lutimonas halocynthiae TaxID=1446477 RepID=UPI0025B5B205|nr:hypothetical protein [Lutimonas halocynthiae]MDN3641774.1 hypothetical protein [Lutimonas halocynthiae]
MNLLIEKISDLNDMMMQGAFLEAFEAFYDEDIVIQVNDDRPVIGKELNRISKKNQIDNIIDFKSAKPLKVTVGEQSTMVEWHINYVDKLLGEKCFTQVAVQDWSDGKIIKEKLYCGGKN